MKVSMFFAWYDFWIGWFWDSKKRVLYICLIPMVVVKIEQRTESIVSPKRDRNLYEQTTFNKGSR